MTAQEMLDYALRLQDEAAREASDRALAVDPLLEDRLGRLTLKMSRLCDDGESYEPPPGLASRTIALVDRRKARPQVGDFVPKKAPFRLADFAVAAVVFFAAMLTLSVPLLRSRMEAGRTACADNLRSLGVSLAKYSSTHGAYPLVPETYPAGTYGVMLQDSKTLTDPSVLSCPADARDRRRSLLPDLNKFRQLIAHSPEAGCSMVGGHFAYNVGYRQSGETVPIPDTPFDVVPIASDGPPINREGVILPGNSPNHGGRGQNVLFSDGHVSWKNNRWVSGADRDIFLNEAHRAAHGLHQADSVLVPSGHRVPGR